MAIKSNPVSNTTDSLSIKSRWGVTACEYAVGGKSVDLQDIMVAISKHRAVAVEGEVAPQATRIRKRNETLDLLGQALADLTSLQTVFKKDDDHSKWSWDYYRQPSEVTCNVLRNILQVGRLIKYGKPDVGPTNQDGNAISKADCEEAIQLVKSKIDGLNNEAQLDMTRLQQLVDRRDESYSTATNLMTSISDTRSNLIRAL